MAQKGILHLLCVLIILLTSNALAFTEISKTGCGDTKGCFSQPSGCDSSKTCDYLVTYSKVNDQQILFELSSKAKWAAIGFNNEGDSMPGTDAVMCTTLGSGIALQHYDITAKSLSGKTNPLPSALILNGTSSEGGRTLCKFYRQIARSGNLKSLSKDHFLVFAYGGVSGDAPLYHDWRSTSGSTVDLGSKSSVTAEETKMTLLKAHGSLMAIAWMGFVAIAIFMARYMKPMWADKTLGGQKVWFTFHRTFMLLGVLFSIISIIMIFVHRKGWSEGIGAHPITGIITFGLALINPVMALLRPHPGEPKRFIFNWAHRTVGLSAFVLATVTIFLAAFLEQLKIEKNAVPTMIVFCVGIAVVVLFEIVLYIRSRNRPETVPGSNGDKVEQMQQEMTTTDSVDEMIRFVAFAFWILVAVGTTIAIVVIINVEIK